MSIKLCVMGGNERRRGGETRTELEGKQGERKRERSLRVVDVYLALFVVAACL